MQGVGVMLCVPATHAEAGGVFSLPSASSSDGGSSLGTASSLSLSLARSDSTGCVAKRRISATSAACNRRYSISAAIDCAGARSRALRRGCSGVDMVDMVDRDVDSSCNCPRVARCKEESADPATTTTKESVLDTTGGHPEGKTATMFPAARRSGQRQVRYAGKSWRSISNCA